MHVAIVGAGALGSVYGYHLLTHHDVSFVVRPETVDSARRVEISVEISIEHASAPARTPKPSNPARFVTTIPTDAEAVLVALRAEHLTSQVFSRIGPIDPQTPVVILTPLMPASLSRLEESLKRRVVVAMPGVVAYQANEAGQTTRHIRYWTPRIAPTWIDRPLATEGESMSRRVSAVVAALVSSGLPTQLSDTVRSMNPATTVAFFPLVMGIAIARSVERLLSDSALLKLGLEASRETRSLARHIGELAPFAGILLSFATPFTARAGIALARARAPESITFIERHFGHKLIEQHAALMKDVRELARLHHQPIDALERLHAQLKPS